MEQLLVYCIAVGALLAIVFIGYVTAKWKFRQSAKHDIYLCVDFLLRNLHELAFYHPTKHNSFIEFNYLYAQLKKERHKWYFNDYWKDYVDEFLISFEETNAFIKEMATYMGEDHYFSHSEYLKCKQLAHFENYKKYIDDNFIKYVNTKEILSYIQVDKYLDIINSDFSDIPQRHNLTFVEEELEKNKEFFDTVMKYPLDKQQRESIVKLEDNALVISSAGSGKTSTMVGKIKYLVEQRGITPAKILPLTFARKASEELTERLGYEEKGLRSYTFHGFALRIVEEVTKQKQNITKSSTMLQCFYHQAKVNQSFKESINLFLTEKNSLTKNQHEYKTGKDYMIDRALYGIQAPFLDMDGRIIFTRSEEEKKICTFLSMNNVLFRYEAPFQYNTTTQFKRQYMPDFTIYFQVNGQWQYVILEHFGIDANGNVPYWFGDGKQGGFFQANQDYHAGIDWKRRITSHYNVRLLETTSAMFHDGTIYKNLHDMLVSVGVKLTPLSEEQKFDRLVVRNSRMEDSLLQLISTFVALMKSNRSSFDGILDTIKNESKNERFIERSKFMLYDIFKPVYEDYCYTLKERKEVDYTDIILRATDFCNEGRFDHIFDFILVDEFQDISIDRFKFLQSLRTEEPYTKLYCVGDDWQSIFRFTGSDLTLFSDFEEYFGYTEKCKIETTYRFGNPLVNISSRFILKNEKQVPKEIKPYSRNAKTELSVHEYYDEDGIKQLDLVKQIIEQVPEEESIMLMARYHADSDFIPSNKIVERDEKRRVTMVKINNRVIPFNTVHSAKGLEADHVILVNCSQDGNGFPSQVSDDPILGYVLSKPETYPFAEERRLFYVAITRAKKHCYVLYKNTCPSPFIADINSEDTGDIQTNHNSMLCPMCQNGSLRKVKTGETPYNKWALFGCTNRTGGCPYTWFVQYQNDSDIDSQYNRLPKPNSN